jgi:alcohol dehydrogenase
VKALVCLGSDKKAAKALQERPRPGLTAPTDAIVKMTFTTICGTDLERPSRYSNRETGC